jgi:hypothetical protein
VGKPFLAGCQDWDGDGCLEWGSLEDCGPGQTCEDLACTGGCTDGCPTLGMTSCADAAMVLGCWDPDWNGCLEWNLAGTCGGGLVCQDGDCVPDPGTCTDDCGEGETRCQDGDVQECGDAGDGDDCLDWTGGTACPCGCTDAACDPCPEAVEEPVAADVVEVSDAGESDTADALIQGDLDQPDPPAADTAAGVEARTSWDTGPADSHGGVDTTGSGRGGGCGAHHAASPHAAGAGLVLMALLLARSRRPGRS